MESKVSKKMHLLQQRIKLRKIMHQYETLNMRCIPIKLESTDSV